MGLSVTNVLIYLNRKHLDSCFSSYTLLITMQQLCSRKKFWQHATRFVVFFFFRFYLFIHEKHRDIHRRRSRLPAGSLMWDLVLEPWDHDLRQRQTLNHSHPGAPASSFKKNV